MPQVLLSVPPDPAFVRLTRLVATDLARKAGVPEDVLDDVRLAVGQACARAVSVHRLEGLPDPVLVGFADDPWVEVTVQDKAPLPAAVGEQAAVVLSQAAAGVASWDVEDRDGVGNGAGGVRSVVPEIALLQALTPELTLATGPAGSVVCMRWPR